MGYIAARTERMPKALGWILMAGGVGYVLSALIGFGFADASSWLYQVLTIPASIGEYWMVGYLLVVGMRAPKPEMA